MVDRLALFTDRRDAGRQLGEALQRFRNEEPLVIALPRGGVPVGFEVAQALAAPLDILLVRKIGAPFNPEYGIGAIAEGGVRFIRREDVELIGIPDEELEAIVAREAAELERRRRLYRGDLEPLPVAGRTVILVDDGIATGGTAVVAGRALGSTARRGSSSPSRSRRRAPSSGWLPTSTRSSASSSRMASSASARSTSTSARSPTRR